MFPKKPFPPPVASAAERECSAAAGLLRLRTRESRHAPAGCCSDWFGAIALPVFWLRVLNRYFDRGRGNGFAPPLRHRQGELGAANADLFGDPHGAVKEDRSAPTFQDVPRSQRPFPPAWVL